MLSLETLKLAKSLCVIDAEKGVAAFETSLGDLQAHLYDEMVLARAAGRLDSIPMKRRLMHRFLWYMSLRLSDWLGRMSFMDWIWSEFAEEENAESLAFYSFGALLIKDFHVDVSALMDSFAPVGILLSHDLDSGEQLKPPAFADIQKGTKRSYRDACCPALLDLVDDTERWWPTIKAIRDVMAHREHTKIVFGEPRQRIKMFQVYDAQMAPRIIEKALLRPSTNNIVDFEKYASFIFSEIVTFAQRLGDIIAAEMKIAIHGKFVHQTRSTYLVSNMDELIQSVEKK